MTNTPNAARRGRALARAGLYAAVLALLPATAHSARIGYDLGLSVMHSDNIGLTDSDTVSDTVISPLLLFDIEQTGSAVRLQANGNLRYPHYVQDTFDDELQGVLSGAMDWEVIPERLDFRITDDLSRQSVNVFESFVPSNQQQVNVFTAGPTFRARFGGAMSGTLGLLYTNTYAEESSDFQGDRYSVAAQLQRALRSTDELTFNLEALQTDFDQEGAFFDYTRYDGYVGYLSSLNSFDIELAAGWSRIEPENYDGDSTSPLFRGDIGWKVAPRTTLSAGFSYEFADAAQNLVSRLDTDDGGVPVPGTVVDPALQIGPQTFRQRRVLLGYRFDGERLSVQVTPSYDRIRYLTAGSEDQDVTAVTAYAQYRLRPELTLSLAAVRQEREYQDVSRNDDSTLFNIGLSRQLSRHWRTQVSYQRWERDSASATQSYVENTLTLSVFYRR